MTRARDAFTLIELLVVLAVIGLLAGMVIPAVQSAREAGRRAECLNNLKQIGLAMQDHEARFGAFPAGSGMRRVGVGSPAKSESHDLPPLYNLLPGLDQAPLYNAFNFGIESDPIGPTSTVNLTATETRVGLFLCPSDHQSRRVTAGSSYRFNVGVTKFAIIRDGVGPDLDRPPCELDVPGGLRTMGSTPAAEVVDGLSQTAAVAERLLGSQGTRFDHARDFWFTGTLALAEPSTAADMVALCGSARDRPPDGFTGLGRSWMSPMYAASWYNHALPPNARAADCTAEAPPSDLVLGDYTLLNYVAVAARSDHGGGAHVLYLDGLARFVAQGIDRRAWWALGTRSGGEPINP